LRGVVSRPYVTHEDGEQPMKFQPLISVIMPARNAGRFVTAAVKSIQNQTYSHWELLVMDDGSIDRTGAILSRLAKKDRRVQLFRNEKSRGIAVSLNMLVKKTRGSYIARMDADDISLPTRLTKQLNYLQNHPKVIACGGSAEMIDSKGLVFAQKHFPTNPDVLHNLIMRMVPIQHPIMLVRAHALKTVRYNEHMRTAEDVDLFFKLLRLGQFGNITDIIYQYRKVDTSNGYHDVKETFYLTFWARFQGIIRYGYVPTMGGVLYSLVEFLVVTALPAKAVVRLYEWYRFRWPMVAIVFEKPFFAPLGKPKLMPLGLG